MAETVVRKSSPVLIAGAWILVVVPTLWGLNYTVRNAAKLFAPAPSATAPAQGAAK